MEKFQCNSDKPEFPKYPDMQVKGNFEWEYTQSHDILTMAPLMSPKL